MGLKAKIKMEIKNKMSESENLPAKTEINLPATVGDEAFAGLAKGDVEYLQFLNLTQPLSDVVMSGQAKMGTFVFGQDGKDLGPETVVVCAMRKDGDKLIPCFRPHALLLVDREVEAESYDPTSKVYQEIAAEAKSKTKVEGRGAMVGIDFLFWTPAVEDFGVFFFKKTAKKEADEFYRLGKAGKVIRAYAHKIVTAYTWFVPKADEYKGDASKLARPSEEHYAKAVDLFMAPVLVKPGDAATASNSEERAR